MPLEIDVLDTQFQTLLQPKPRAIKEGHGEPRDAGEMAHDAPDFIAAQDDRNALGHTRPRQNHAMSSGLSSHASSASL